MKEKQRVLHLIQSLDSGGCENMLLRTLPRMTAHFEHTIMTLKERGELAPQFEAQGIMVKQAPVTLSLLGYNGGRALARAIATLQPDIVLTYLFHADVFGRQFLQPHISAPVIPFLRTTHNFSRYWPARLFEKLTRNKVRRYFANSDAVKEFYVSQIGAAPQKFIIIPNGIDIPAMRKTADTPPEKPLPITEKSQVITCVANLAPNKGHATLVAAFDAVATTFPDAALLLVGEGEERAKLESQIAASSAPDRIHLLGRRSDVPQILKHTDIFVLPTLFEGLSNALQEAMAMGCACITTDIPENRQLIEPGKTGVLVPPQDVAALQTALRELLEHNAQRETYGTAAQAFIKEHFDLDTVAAQWEEAMLAEIAEKGAA